MLLEGARDVEQRRVAAQRERDPVLDGQAGRLACVLDRVDDLLREALAAQPLVERKLEGDGMRPLPLELVAVQRRERHDEVLADELVVVPVHVDRHGPALAQRAAARPGSSAATAAATCGIALPKRGPSAR